MFLAYLIDALDDAIRKVVLRRYGVHSPPVPDVRRWKYETVDSTIQLKSGQRRSLKSIITEHMIEPIESANGAKTLPPSAMRSALLFGPPGTGKTTFVERIAQAVGWDFVLINPSEFLERGLEGIYSAANELFGDLRDLERAIVFFDEMDAMVQRRVDESGKQQLAPVQQFLTTSMLPHLADLYDARKVLFFVATNHKGTFDQAITRPGRFDMLLFIGPPQWKQKVAYVDECAPIKYGTESERKAKVKRVGKQLLDWIPANDKLSDVLDKASVGETKAMFKSLIEGRSLDEAIDGGHLTEAALRKGVEKWRNAGFSLITNKDLAKQYDDEKDTSEIRN